MLGLTAIFKLVALGGVVITALFFTGKKLYEEHTYRQNIIDSHKVIMLCLSKSEIQDIHKCYEGVLESKK